MELTKLDLAELVIGLKRCLQHGRRSTTRRNGKVDRLGSLARPSRTVGNLDFPGRYQPAQTLRKLHAERGTLVVWIEITQHLREELCHSPGRRRCAAAQPFPELELLCERCCGVVLHSPGSNRSHLTPHEARGDRETRVRSGEPNSVAVPGMNREFVSMSKPVLEILSRSTSRPQGNLTVDSHGTSLRVRRWSRSRWFPGHRMNGASAPSVVAPGDARIGSASAGSGCRRLSKSNASVKAHAPRYSVRSRDERCQRITRNERYSLTALADDLEQAAGIPMHSSLGLQKHSTLREIDEPHLRAIPDSCDLQPQQLGRWKPSMYAPIFGRHTLSSVQPPILRRDHLPSFLRRLQSPPKIFRERMGIAGVHSPRRVMSGKKTTPAARRHRWEIRLGRERVWCQQHLHMAAIRQRPKVREQLRLIGRGQERRQENQVRKAIVKRVEKLVFRVDEGQPCVRKSTRASKGDGLFRIWLKGKNGRVRGS